MRPARFAGYFTIAMIALFFEFRVVFGAALALCILEARGILR